MTFFLRSFFVYSSVFFLILQCFIRIGIGFFLQKDPMTLIEGVKIFCLGSIFDLSVLCFFLMIPVFYHHLTTAHFKTRKIHTILCNGTLFLFLCTILFTAFAEFIFWEEFSARFNFIAVDYLIYTTEVIRNIHESYNLPLLLGGIGALSLLSFWGIKRLTVPNDIPLQQSFLTRIMSIIGIVSIAASMYWATPSSSFLHQHLSIQTHRELAQNGIFSLFSAFFNNSLDYNQFYLTQKDLKDQGTDLVNDLEQSHVTPSQVAPSKDTLKKYNVILVLMESMSAEFMASFGNTENLTPCLDDLSKDSIFFTRMYATGTRTVRGVEAITLAIPPSPGQAIVKRPHNEDLTSLGTIMGDHDYYTAFIYGGNSYFDNMGHFFSHNGFDVIDRNNFTEDEIQLENAWGVCDEDLFQKVIKEADQALHQNKPFMFFALTTSNHRPYTYPVGKIDLAPKVTGRSGGVKYADFAVGELIRLAKKRPWFKNTVFIFVADHTHGTTGRLEITPEKHHIPCLFYAPFLLPAQKIDAMVSQIDVMPTLFGILGIPFKNGVAMNVLKESPNRAFISNFQKLGYLTYDKDMQKEALTVLKPVKDVSFYENGIVLKNNDVLKTPFWKNHLTTSVQGFSMASQWKEVLRKKT